jgi:hypothetical protein
LATVLDPFSGFVRVNHLTFLVGQESWYQILFGGLIILFCRFQRILNTQPKKKSGTGSISDAKIPSFGHLSGEGMTSFIEPPLQHGSLIHALW